MTSFIDLEVFVRTVEGGSFSAAARALDITPAAASIAIKRLEQRLGVRLLVRSTRSLRLTEEGQRYLDSARLALGALAEGEQAIREKHQGLSGVLQISAPSDFGRNLLLGWLDEFKRQHPHIQLQLLINDRHADLFREPVDIALRFGQLADSSLVALPILSQHRRLICASPAYLQQHGVPQTPADLAQHSILIYQPSGRRQAEWRFWRGDELTEVPLTGRYFTDDGEVARRWALAGHGIVRKSAIDVVADIQAGRLLALLPEWQSDTVPISLVCPHRSQVSERVRLLQRFLQQRCQDWMAHHLL
ncbi:MAG: LysR family transcriptional regulator [Serratia proteamaculans]|uniref:LysR family transcriptional regulator n=1 Tax=Serratia proteamaculans TaxID=28151 RepID=UPI00217841FC|nr:LysR family transcriptional regulator [Serratia proteamaculans]CAI1737176.1 D-malate degradation protein R [Serratia proteamaculans]